MKQNFLMLAAIFGALLTGCSNEEIANVETSQQNVIGFNVISNKAQTKATPITPSNLTTTDFDVFAYTEDGTAFMGNVDTDFLHNGVKITYKNGKWDYNDETELRYWPSKDTPLDFYAVSPGTVTSGYDTHYLWNFNHDKQQIYYACMDEYGNGTGKHEDHDVMYGIAKAQTKDTNKGTVKFTFKHALSQVAFKAKTELANMEVTINEIEIMHAKMSGTFTLPKDADTDATAEANWTLPDSGGDYTPTVVKDANISVSSNVDATDISCTTPIFTIPQKLTQWNVSNESTKTKEQADASYQSYLKIICKIKQSGVYVVGSDSNYGTIYVPFGADWQPGKRYIYTLIFGGGYDENGDPILKPIQFDAETSDWVDAENDINLND